MFSDHSTLCTSHFVTKSVIVSLKFQKVDWVTYRINYWTLLVLFAILNMNSLDSGGNDKASVFILMFTISYICNVSLYVVLLCPIGFLVCNDVNFMVIWMTLWNMWVSRVQLIDLYMKYSICCYRSHLYLPSA